MKADELSRQGYAHLNDHPAGALELFDEALRLQATHREAALGRGAALSKLGRLQEAATAFERAAKLRPGEEDALHLWAAHEELCGNLAQAIAAWSWLAQSLPHRSDAWFRVALLAESLGEEDKALAAREALAAAKPGPETLVDLALAQSRLGRHQEAVRSFQRVETIEPGYLAQRPVALQAFVRSRQGTVVAPVGQ